MTRILITSGPTRQYLDPIRYLTNASSGRMGAALAEAALQAGCEVVIVSGPVEIDYPAAAQVVPVVSTEEMLEASLRLFPSCDGVIGVAAPCDYRPKTVAKNKLSKQDLTQNNARGEFLLTLQETPDIMAALGTIKRKKFHTQRSKTNPKTDLYSSRLTSLGPHQNPSSSPVFCVSPAPSSSVSSSPAPSEPHELGDDIMNHEPARPQWMVGFALETTDHQVRALQKLQKKCCDLIVLNDQTAINGSTTSIEILDPLGNTVARHSGNKTIVAQAIVQLILHRFPSNPDK